MEKCQGVAAISVPEATLASASGRRRMPVIGMGSVAENFDPEEFKTAMLEAIRIGYRHFDTASVYGSEKALGEALAEAIQLGIVTREQLFVTSKLWPTDSHPHYVLHALNNSLRTMQLDYLDLYLIHFPISGKPTKKLWFHIDEEDLLAMDYKGVWKAMEECQTQGLTKSIGVSNFSCNKLQHILSFATIPPSVNQVEMNPVWQQRKLVELCKTNEIVITAFSPLGARGTYWGTNAIMENEILNEIAKARGKSVAQVCLRWLYEQGVTFAVKSFNKERMMQNLDIFNWALTEEDRDKIKVIPQHKIIKMEEWVTPRGPFKTLEEMWDGEI